MTLYFSHSAVEGILLWGFWDQAVYDQKIALDDFMSYWSWLFYESLVFGCLLS
jgi:hypothetical protein